MHSPQHSRGRILFEVMCAWAAAASCAGAWIQTGASALLPAAAAAFLYGAVHLFDMAGRNPARAEEPQREFPVAAPENAPADDKPTGQLVDDLAGTRATEDAPAKPARKTRARAPKKPKLVEVTIDAIEAEPPVYHDGSDHPPLAPLFEPLPAVRQLRTFGRKAG